MSDAMTALKEGLSTKYVMGRRGRLSDGATAAPNAQLFKQTEENMAPKRLAQELGESFHGQKEPNLEIKTERPEHRFIAYLRAQGKSVLEIFLHFGGQVDVQRKPISGTGEYSYAWLSQICRQPWFQARVVAIMQDAGLDIVQKTLEMEVLPSIQKLVELRECGVKPVEKSAADSLLDRFLGKPTQKIETEQTIKHGRLEDDAEKITSELEAVEAQIRALGGN